MSDTEVFLLDKAQQHLNPVNWVLPRESEANRRMQQQLYVNLPNQLPSVDPSQMYQQLGTAKNQAPTLELGREFILHEGDFLRTGLLRFTGYVNEAAEALYKPLQEFSERVFTNGAPFKNVISKFGSPLKFTDAMVHHLSYSVVYLYALADAVYSGKKSYDHTAKDASSGEKWFNGLTKGTDAAFFQYLASAILPAFAVSKMRQAADAAVNSIVTNTALPLESPAHKEIILAENGFTKAWNRANEFLSRWIFGIPNRIFDELFVNNKVIGFNFDKHVTYKAMAPALKKTFEVIPGLEGLLKRSNRAQVWLPATIAFGMIPLVLKPIDKGVETFLDWTYRPYVQGLRELLFHKNVEDQLHYAETHQADGTLAPVAVMAEPTRQSLPSQLMSEAGELMNLGSNAYSSKTTTSTTNPFSAATTPTLTALQANPFVPASPVLLPAPPAQQEAEPGNTLDILTSEPEPEKLNRSFFERPMMERPMMEPPII